MFASAVQERAQILLAPDIIDDHQDAAVAQRLAERSGGGGDGLKPRRRAGENRNEVGDDGEQVVGLLAEFDPQHAVDIGILDVGIVRQRLGKGGLAVAARALERHRMGHYVAFGIEELLLERAEFTGARHEVGRRLRGHHGDALFPALVLQDAD